MINNNNTGNIETKFFRFGSNLASAVDTLLNWVQSDNDNLTRKERANSEHSSSKQSDQESSDGLESVRLVNWVNRRQKERSNSEHSYSSKRSDQELSDNLDPHRPIRQRKKRKCEVWISADTGIY